MSTLAPPRSDRITVRRRADLTVTPVEKEGRVEWVVKDPVARRYFRLADHEYFLFRRLDGRVDVEQLRREYQDAHPPRTITRRRLGAFLTTLLRAGLVNVEGAGRGRFLRNKSRDRKRAERRSRWKGVPSFRLRGVDPSACLDALLPLGRFVFSPRGALALGVLVLWAAATAVGHWDRLIAELVRASMELRFVRAVPIVAAVIGMKIVHELAHGLACKRFGGECRELGLMWILCAPLPYCDVSDAWTFRKRLHRVTVALAGILAETAVAAVAILYWRYTTSGPLHDTALFVGVAALVSTLVVNGNPLMRFDGYFALCDSIGVPNLAERSRREVARCFSLRRAGAKAPQARRKLGYLAYGLASMGYRMAVLMGAYLFILRMGRSYEISWAAWLVVLWLCGGMVAPIVGPALAWFVGRGAARRDGTKSATRGRVRGRYAVAAVIGAALFVPLPRSVVEPLVVETSVREPAFSAAAGRLQRIGVVYGATVRPGDVLAVFENSELDADLAKVDGEIRRLQRHLTHLQVARNDDPLAAGEIRRIEESCRSLANRRAILAAERERLTVVAKGAGTFYPPAAAAAPTTPSDELPAWSGRPLDPQNLGATMAPGVLLGEAASNDRWRAIVVLNEGEAAQLRVGDRAAIRLESRAECLSGIVESVTPESIAPGATAATKRNSIAADRLPKGVRYRVAIRLEGDAHHCPGANGEARLTLPAESLFRQVLRRLSNTFSAA